MNIGVTGTIGSGKSRVCEVLQEMLDAKVVSADSICRKLLAVERKGWKAVRNCFDSGCFHSDGTINREFLREKIFSDDTMRAQLDGLLHPLVREELQQAAAAAKTENRILLAEVPLLFEKGWQDDFDWTLLVVSDEKQCVRRIMERDSVSEKQALQAVRSQMAVDDKIRLADSVIDNSSSFLKTRQQLEEFVRVIFEKRKKQIRRGER